MASQPIYQFYAELKDYKPLIWRRFQVAGNITLAQLGYVTMTLFEMKGSHLFHLEYSVNENKCSSRNRVPNISLCGSGLEHQKWISLSLTSKT